MLSICFANILGNGLPMYLCSNRVINYNVVNFLNWLNINSTINEKANFTFIIPTLCFKV